MKDFYLIPLQDGLSDFIMPSSCDKSTFDGLVFKPHAGLSYHFTRGGVDCETLRSKSAHFSRDETSYDQRFRSFRGVALPMA
ncbi:hypothetical protein HK28_06340 [Acetobacter sp. DsW_063]|nr:hypothetical protein HK28_06340 [Acetobacter sp. DsW_063]